MDEEHPPDWTVVVDRYAELVFRIAYRILGSADDAEDVSQNVFIEAQRNFAVGPIQSWAGLFSRLATTRAIDMLRKRRTTQILDESQSVSNKRIYRDFEWNIPVDDSLFEIPSGKRVVRSTILARPTEHELIGAFTIRQAFAAEPYTESFLEKSNKPGLKLSQLAYDSTKTPEENFRRQISHLRDHWQALGLSEAESNDPAKVQMRIDYLSMKLDDWATTIASRGGWVGTGVKPGEEKPLCWWRDGGKTRMLLANMTIAESETPPPAN